MLVAAVALTVLAFASGLGKAIARLPVDLLVVADEPPAHADAIAIHGGGAVDAAREQLATRLWREGRVARVVALGGALPLGDPDVTYARAVERRLRQAGLPDDALLRLDEGSSTGEEVMAVRALAEREGWQHVVLVSTAWHTRRVSIAAGQTFAGSPVGWTVAAPTELGFDADAWWSDRATRGIVLGEWLRIGLILLFPVA